MFKRICGLKPYISPRPSEFMVLTVSIILFVLGLIGLWFGANLAIGGSLKVVSTLRISKLFIGLTIISIGTSLPEIFTHIVASLSILKGTNASGVAVGTNIGSNIIQITLILGLIGLLATVKSSKIIQRRDGLIMLGGIALLFLAGFNGIVSRVEGILLAGLYILYIIYLSKNEKNIGELFDGHSKNILTSKSKHTLSVGSLELIFGIFLLLLSAEFVVKNALIFANTFGIAQTFIGTIIIGVSTALPELTTALIGIKRGAKDISLGVLIGSNITNPMLALGLGAAISGLSMPRIVEWIDIPFWFIISVIALFFFADEHKIDKHEAIFLIISYLVFVAYKIYML